jgi:hypothetical protein
VDIKDVHLRLERAQGEGAGAPPFSVGFVLPSMNVQTNLAKKGTVMETSMTLGTAGIYCRAGELGEEASVTRPQSTPIRPRAHSNAPASKKDAALQEAERQRAFFVCQNEIRDRMNGLTKETSSWPTESWFLAIVARDGSAEGGDAYAVSASIVKDLDKDVDRFTYERPIQVQRVTIGAVQLQATEAQLAALLSLSTHGADYKLWSSYGIVRGLLGLPNTSGDTETAEGRRALWKASVRAVIASVSKVSLKTSNLAQVLMDAKRYKQTYIEFLNASILSKDSAMTTSKLSSPVASRQARASFRQSSAGDPRSAVEVQLQRLEDTLPVGTLAWCRLVAQKHVKAMHSKKGGSRKSSSGGDDGDGDGGDGGSAMDDGDDDLATRMAEGAAVVDPRVEQAPPGYVTHVKDVKIGCFSAQLLRSLSLVERLERGLASIPDAALTGTYGVELMMAELPGINARLRSIKGSGSSTDVAIRAIRVRSGRAGAGVSPDAAPKSQIVLIEGATSGIDIDSLLGGPVEYSGDISSFVATRQHQATGFAKRLASSAIGSVGSLYRAYAGDASQADEERGSDGSGADGGDGASAALPAVVLHQLKASNEASPHEMIVNLAPAQINYLPPFWVALEAFLRPLERVKWSSQLGETAMLRQKYHKISRAAEKLMREGWHNPRANIINVFVSFTDTLTSPSPRHALDVRLGGFRFALMSDEDDHSEEIMLARLPPMSITKSPKVGDPLPDKACCAINFNGPIQVESGVDKKLGPRIQSIANNGVPASRLEGSRDFLISEVRALHAQIAALEAEKERLKVIHSGLRTGNLASAIGIISPSLPSPGAASPQYAALYGSEELDKAIAVPPSPAGSSASGAAASGDSKLMDKLSAIESMVGEIKAWAVRKKRRGVSLFSPRRASSLYEPGMPSMAAVSGTAGSEEMHTPKQ